VTQVRALLLLLKSKVGKIMDTIEVIGIILVFLV